jgi:hypothetical protein
MVAVRLTSVIGEPTPSDAPLRLSDLRRDQPADTTLRNLLGVLSAKLELCASLPVYEWEAGSEGHASCALAFRHLAEMERRTCNDVLEQLRLHLDRRSSAEGDAA